MFYLFYTNHNSKQVIFSVVMALGRETILLLETFMRLRSSLKDHTINIDLICVFCLYTLNMKWTFTCVHCDLLFSSIHTINQLLFAIFSYWKSLMFHSDKMNTLLLPRPAAEVHLPKQCLKTCRPTNSMSKFQRCLLQRNILVLRGYNWMLLAHRPYCTVTLNSNLAILKTWKCLQLE